MRRRVALLLAVVVLGACGGDTTREDGERQLSEVTVPAGWTASTVDYQPAGMERRYDQWTVNYRNLAPAESAVKDSYAEALRSTGWAACGTGAVHNDLVQGDYCKKPYEIVLATRRGTSCVPSTMDACTELTVTLYKVEG